MSLVLSNPITEIKTVEKIVTKTKIIEKPVHVEKIVKEPFYITKDIEVFVKNPINAISIVLTIILITIILINLWINEYHKY